MQSRQLPNELDEWRFINICICFNKISQRVQQAYNEPVGKSLQPRRMIRHMTHVFYMCCVRSPNNIVWMMGTTDRGPNELAAKKMIQCAVKDLPSFFYLPGSCYEHASHLGVLGALKLADRLLETHGRSWRYFSSVAMITNTLRDQSPALFAAWRVLFGDSDAMTNVRALFPRCIAERWGSVAETERRLLQAGVPRIAKAVRHVFETSPKLLSDAVAEEAGDDAEAVDQLSVDDKKSYKKKMGKWRRATVETLQDSLFEAVLNVMHESMAPFIHLSNYLKKKLPVGAAGHLFHLVTGKASEILLEFDNMLFCSLACTRLRSIE